MSKPDIRAIEFDLIEMAKSAYSAYGKAVDYKNFRGDPMPAFMALPTTISAAWIASVGDVIGTVLDEVEDEYKVGES